MHEYSVPYLHQIQSKNDLTIVIKNNSFSEIGTSEVEDTISILVKRGEVLTLFLINANFPMYLKLAIEGC